MRTRQSPTAELSVDREHLGVISLDQRGELHVTQLADIEMAALGTEHPAEEQIRRRLHQPLAHHHPLAVVGVDTLTGIGFQHRGVGLLELQEQRIVGDGHHQGHHAQCPDAADADHFDSRVDQLVAIEQDTAVLCQGFAIWCETLTDHLYVAGGARRIGVKNSRRRVVNARLPARLLDQLWEHQLRTAGSRRFGDPFLKPNFALF